MQDSTNLNLCPKILQLRFLKSRKSPHKNRGLIEGSIIEINNKYEILITVNYLLIKSVSQLRNECNSICFCFFKFVDALFQKIFFLLQLFG